MTYYPLIKHLLYMKSLEKAAKEMQDRYIWPWNTTGEVITVERVTPATVKGRDVEQQAEEGNVQLSTQVEEQS